MPKSTPHFMERGVDRCRLIDFPVVASGQLPQPFQEWLGRLTIRCFSKSKKKNNFKGLPDVFGLGQPLSEDFTGVPTSSRRYLWRRHLDSKMAAPEMTSTRTWGELFEPNCGGGGKWGPLHFQQSSWMTSFQRNRKWGHRRWRLEAENPPISTNTKMGVKKFSLYYWYLIETWQRFFQEYFKL